MSVGLAKEAAWIWHRHILASDNQSTHRFLAEARAKASEVVAADHISAQAKDVIKDLLAIIDTLNDQVGKSSNQSADVRLLRKKLEVERKETRTMEGKIEELKKIVLGSVIEVKTIANEANAILKRNGTAFPEIEVVSLNKVRASTQKLAETMLKVSEFKVESSAKDS